MTSLNVPSHMRDHLVSADGRLSSFGNGSKRVSVTSDGLCHDAEMNSSFVFLDSFCHLVAVSLAISGSRETKSCNSPNVALLWSCKFLQLRCLVEFNPVRLFPLLKLLVFLQIHSSNYCNYLTSSVDSFISLSS